MDAYATGDFKGHLHMKVLSKHEAEIVINKIKGAGLWHGDNNTFAKLDLPVEIRAVRSALFVGRKILTTAGGFDPKGLWIDKDAGSLFCGLDVVFTALVSDSKLGIQFEEGWSDYITQDAEWDTMIETQNKKLKDKKAPPTKGLGKSKASGKGR